MSDDRENDPFASPHAAPPAPMAQPGLGDFVPMPAQTPASPYGYGAPDRIGSSQKNYLGILALILPFVSLSVVGIIMGHLGLSAVKKGTANNHGIALAGTIVSWVVTLMVGPLLLAAIAIPVYFNQQAAVAVSGSEPSLASSPVAAGPDEAVTPDGSAAAGSLVDFSALAVGDCIADPYDGVEVDANGDSWITGVTIVDCASTHYGEVFAAGDLRATDYVQDDIFAEADDLCYFAFEDFMGVSYVDSAYYYEAFSPTPAGWEAGDRATTCVVTSYASDTVGTLQGSGR